MDILYTERLTLSEVTQADAAFIFELLTSPTWLEHIGDRGMKTKEDALGYINKSLIQSYRKNGFGLLKIVHNDTGRVLGLCGLIKRKELDFPDIGYALLPEFEGNGFAFEASHAILEAEREKAIYPEILAITTDANVRSRALLEKLKMSYLRHVSIPNDNEELRLYSIRFK